MKINLKEKPELGCFIFSIIVYPLITILVIFLIESAILRYVDLTLYEWFNIPYFFVWFLLLILIGINSACMYLLDYEREERCVHCLKIFPKGEIVDLAKKGEEGEYFSQICKKCLKELNEKYNRK